MLNATDAAAVRRSQSPGGHRVEELSNVRNRTAQDCLGGSHCLCRPDLS